MKKIFRLTAALLLLAGILYGKTVAAAAPPAEETAEEKCTHIFETQIGDPTEEEAGRITYVCKKCGFQYTESIPAYGHVFTEHIREPDCIHAGCRTIVCTRCGFVQTKEILPPLGHEIDFRKAAGSVSDQSGSTGTGIFQCERCGRKIPVSVPLRSGKGTEFPNAGDILFFFLELAAVNLFLMVLCLYKSLKCWHRRQVEEYQKHHVKWREGT